MPRSLRTLQRAGACNENRGCPVPCVLCKGRAHATSQTRRWHTHNIRPRNQGCPVPCAFSRGGRMQHHQPAVGTLTPSAPGTGGAPFLAYFARGGRMQHHKPADKLEDRRECPVPAFSWNVEGETLKRKESYTLFPLLVYGAPGGLRQDRGHVVESRKTSRTETRNAEIHLDQ